MAYVPLREAPGCSDQPQQIVYVKIPHINQGGGKTQRHFAYVEFGDEEAMKAGLAMKGEVRVSLQADKMLR